MAKANETISDIIKWLRLPRDGENGYLAAWRDEIADRLEAALKHEKATAEKSSAVGNCAKLREALMYAEQVLDTAARNVRGETGMVINSAYSEAARKCRAALAAPPRNCDRMNVDDAFSAFSFMCDTTDCKDCPYKQHNRFGDRELCAMLFLFDDGNGGKEGVAE